MRSLLFLLVAAGCGAGSTSADRGASPSVASPAADSLAPNANAAHYGPHGVAASPAAPLAEAPNTAAAVAAPAASPDSALPGAPAAEADEQLAAQRGHPCQCGKTCHCGHCSGAVPGCHCHVKRADENP